MTGPPPDSWVVDPAAATARPVVEGLWRLRLPLPWAGNDHVNAYLIERDDGVMLVDCGTAGDRTCVRALETAVGHTGHTLADVRVLVLTHAHSDHAGLAGHVLRRSGAELWLHPRAEHFYDVLADPSRIGAIRAEVARREGVPPSRIPVYADVREELEGCDELVQADRPLTDATRLPSRLGDWDVVETPGHAPSHVCLLQRERGLLIGGDLLCAAFVPWMDYGYTPDPYGETLASLDRLESLGDIDLVLPGHGRPLADLSAAVGLQRAGFTARIDALSIALAEGPASAYELTDRVFGDEDDLAAVTHLVEVVSYLRHLRLRGAVVRDVHDAGPHHHRLNTGVHV
jgi:glyoxylase-like metal-dependent hydrolase (beta-lactamase superfamily II)